MDDFLLKIQDCLKKYKRKPRNVNYEKYKKVASVIIPIVRLDDSYGILMTKRTNHLKNHSGEISFPGGSQDPEDRNLAETALRELKEEIGILEQHVKILGFLQNEFSVTYFTVKPYVAYIEDFNLCMLKPDPFEVEKVMFIPLNFFFDKKNQWKETWLRNDEKHINFFYNYEGNIIWGLSGRIINIFTSAIRDCV
ncbi:NUDIX hydrolase [Calditerrivibrio sp.]|uniref:NUDIX hydrolase n=1 Tax=Calditerrivibrio sp. TaxID=2792612 RepID=UPI003D0BD2D6